jgi:hypothetical protein
MAKTIMRIAGLDGQVELMNDRVVIHRQGIFNALKFGFNSKREIPIGAISEVAFKGATPFRFGEIEFVRSGRSVDERKVSRNATVRFRKLQHRQFEELKEKVFELMESHANQRQHH